MLDREQAGSGISEIIRRFEGKLEGYASDERTYQLSVRLKQPYGALIERMRHLLNEQLRKKQAADSTGKANPGKEATKAEALEWCLDLAKQLLDLREES